MKQLVLVSLTLLAVACDDTPRPGKVTAQDVRDSLADAGRTTNAYVSQTRDELVAKAQHEVDDVDAQMAKLRKQAQGAAAGARTHIDAQIADLEKQRTQVDARLAALKNATGDAWKDMANGLNKAVDDLQNASKKAGSD